MNVQILGAMLRQGCAQRSFPYVIDILQISLDENIKPNEAFLRHLHNFYNHCARAIDGRVSKEFCFLYFQLFFVVAEALWSLLNKI